MSNAARIGKIVLVLLGLSFGLAILGALEWAVRSQLGVYRCDDRLGWTFRPGASGIKLNRHGEFFNRIDFNAEGFNDEEWGRPQEDVYRVLLLGDSIAASLQVPRPLNFVSRTEQILNDQVQPGRRIEILNAGVDGYGTGQELLLLRATIPRHPPELVLLQTYISNDLPDNSRLAGNWNHYLANRCGRPYFHSVNGEVALRSLPQPYRSSGFDRLLRYSTLYSAIIAPPTRAGDGPAFRIAHAFASDPPPAWYDSWALTKRLIRAARDEARKHGASFAVVASPAKQAVGQLNEHQRARNVPLEQWQRSHDMLVSFLGDEGLAHVDLLPPLRRFLTEAGGSPYFEIDSHWTVDGHRIAAEALAKGLMERCEELGLPVQGCGTP